MSPTTSTQDVPQSHQPKIGTSKSKLSSTLVLVIVVLAFALGGLLGYMMGIQRSSTVTPTSNVNQSTLSGTKAYVNDFYHLSFDIPTDWKVEEYKKEDGVPAFKLTSADGQISIETPLPDFRQEGTVTSLKSTNHIKQDLDNTTVQLGEYSMTRGRYINDFDEVQDYISLYNIPFQKGVNLFFTVKGDYDSNNQKLLAVLKTFKFTQKEPSLDTLISYQLPTGWTREERNPANETDDDSLSFVSPDLTQNEVPSIITGAILRVSRHLKDPRKTMVEIIEKNLPLPLEDEAGQAKPVKIGTADGLNLLTCWEGCYDGYYIEQGDYYWLITFTCGNICSSKAQMDTSKYAKDRDTFLNSFSFK